MLFGRYCLTAASNSCSTMFCNHVDGEHHVATVARVAFLAAIGDDFAAHSVALDVAESVVTAEVLVHRPLDAIDAAVLIVRIPEDVAKHLPVGIDANEILFKAEGVRRRDDLIHLRLSGELSQFSGRCLRHFLFEHDVTARFEPPIRLRFDLPPQLLAHCLHWHLERLCNERGEGINILQQRGVGSHRFYRFVLRKRLAMDVLNHPTACVDDLFVDVLFRGFSFRLIHLRTPPGDE